MYFYIIFYLLTRLAVMPNNSNSVT